MHIPRIVLGCSVASPNGSIRIDGEQHHYLTRVVRLIKGDTFEVIINSAQPQTHLAQLTNITDNFSEASLLATVAVSPCSPTHMIVGLPKPPVADFIVEKSIELSVAHLIFFTANRTQGRLSPEQAKNKLARFERIKEAALKQSGAQSVITKIEFSSSLEQCLQMLHGEKKKEFSKNFDAERRIICNTPNPLSHPPTIINLFSATNKNAQQSEQLKQAADYAENFIIIGPEGGLSEDEEALAFAFSYQSATLGKKVLRAETAFVVAAAAAMLFE